MENQSSQIISTKARVDHVASDFNVCVLSRYLSSTV